jgi:hypothetical protein
MFIVWICTLFLCLRWCFVFCFTELVFCFLRSWFYFLVNLEDKSYFYVYYKNKSLAKIKATNFSTYFQHPFNSPQHNLYSHFCLFSLTCSYNLQLSLSTFFFRIETLSAFLLKNFLLFLYIEIKSKKIKASSYFYLPVSLFLLYIFVFECKIF